MVSQSVWLIIFALSLIAAIYFGIEYLTYKPDEQIKHKEIELPEDSLEAITEEERALIARWSLDMMLNHGHEDYNGLLVDRASGIPLNKLMKRKCSKCEIPRNKKSDKEGMV